MLEYWNTHTIEPSNTVNGLPVRYYRDASSVSIVGGSGQVILANCSGANIRTQAIHNSTAGIEIGYSTDVSIQQSSIRDQTWFGIYSYGSYNLNLTGIHLENTSYGFHAIHTGHNSIVSSEIFGNGHGIYISNSDNDIIASNEVSLNQYGIVMENVMDSLIHLNHLEENDLGASLAWSTGNRIHHNHFIDNSVQASDSDFLNQWDDGYPSGGNWWSDYMGIDNRSGPNQDLPGSDGIGDTPYYLYDRGLDRYPLNPVRPPPPPTNLTTSVLSGKHVLLNWTAPSSSYVNYYLIYRSTDQNGFDFSRPLHNTSDDAKPLETSWVDVNAANSTSPREYYYVVRAAYTSEATSLTSNTAGRWIRFFDVGVQTFSLPLEPFENHNVSWYARNIPNIEHIRWMDSSGHWISHTKGIGEGHNDTVVWMGTGYEISLIAPTRYVFCGQPASMIRLREKTGYAIDFRNSLSAQRAGSSLTLTWKLTSGATEYKVFRSERRGGLNDDSLQPIATVPSNQNTWTDVDAVLIPGERHYLVVPVDSSGDLGSSTYSIGAITVEYSSSHSSISMPLKPAQNPTLDWYCDQIPNAVGMAFMFSGLWKFHSKDMPLGAYDPQVVQGLSYQLSLSSVPSLFTYIGY